MRSIECLVNQYPNKTGREILAIQAQDKIEDQKIYEEENKEKIAFVNDIDKNGGYFRGKFGIDQYYYYRVFDVIIDNNELIGSVEKIVLFHNDTNNNHSVIKPCEIKLERRIKEYERLDTYGLEYEERITKEDWDAINNYLNKISKLFW